MILNLLAKTNQQHITNNEGEQKSQATQVQVNKSPFGGIEIKRSWWPKRERVQVILCFGLTRVIICVWG